MAPHCDGISPIDRENHMFNPSRKQSSDDDEEERFVIIDWKSLVVDFSCFSKIILSIYIIDVLDFSVSDLMDDQSCVYLDHWQWLCLLLKLIY